MKFTVTSKKVNIMSKASANMNQENRMQNASLEISKRSKPMRGINCAFDHHDSRLGLH